MKKCSFEKMQETSTFERLNFFFIRQSCDSIKQIIFQKHCFNGTIYHNNLHILYQKAIKFNIYEMTYESVPHNFYL